MPKVTAPRETAKRRSPDDFDRWMERFGLELQPGPYFTTAAKEPLFKMYLGTFSKRLRQQHDCHACRRFLEQYGGLVTLDADGNKCPLLWRVDTSGAYAGLEKALALAVATAPVNGVFYSSAPAWGQARTGEWSHFALKSPARWEHPIKRANEAAAERDAEYGMLCRSLAEFPVEVVRRAVALLETDALYRSEKVLGVATWLLELHERRASALDMRRVTNVTWHAVATAPPGFAHVRSSMIGTLLEDIQAGLHPEEVARRFREKMHPLQYQRPSAPPSEGNIRQAEAAFEALNAAGALKRRFARLEDIETVWRPPAPVEAPRAGGVFGHLRAKVGGLPTELNVAPTRITWEKFARTVLPAAEKLEYWVNQGRRLPLAALVTAADLAAPPIIQWDTPERRNPVTWYLYNGGSLVRDWNLHGGGWHPVTAATLLPSQWDAARPMPHHGSGVVLILDGCRDAQYRQGRGGGLFPEHLKSDFHGLRRTLEAYSREAEIAGRDEATACGVMLRGPTWDATVRVTASNNIAVEYKLDRWD